MNSNTRYILSKYRKDSKSLDFCANTLSGQLDLINFPNLTKLDCSNNDITNIVNIPYLKILICAKNKLDNLDYLPNTLEYLDCSENKNINNLDNLPSSLIFLNCNHCYIKNLNNLPFSLKTLRCENNILSVLPPQLNILHCNFQLDNFEIPDSLYMIYYTKNKHQYVNKMNDNQVEIQSKFDELNNNYICNKFKKHKKKNYLNESNNNEIEHYNIYYKKYFKDIIDNNNEIGHTIVYEKI